MTKLSSLSEYLKNELCCPEKHHLRSTQTLNIPWHVDMLLVNDREISKYTTAVTK
jgi:hypothetical protein